MDVLFSEILQGIQDLWRHGDEKISGGAGWCRSNNTQPYFVEGESDSMFIYRAIPCKSKKWNTRKIKEDPSGCWGYTIQEVRT